MIIKNRFTEAIIYQNDASMMNETVEAAVKNGVNLRNADLRGVDLRGANKNI